MNSMDTATKLRAQFLSGERTPTQVVAEALQTIKEKDGELHAFLHTYEDAIEAAEILELEPVDDGANVWLIEPFDAVVFDRTRWITPASRSTPIVTAAPTQVVADLWTSPGRGPQEASALIQEMRRSENAWRTDP